MHVADPMLSKINWRIAIVCIAGLTLSIYSFTVELAKERDPFYTAFCDITKTISCTDVLTSEYSKGFGIFPKSSFFQLHKVPNVIFGIIFFSMMLIVALKNTYAYSITALTFGIMSLFMSMYLAFILYKLEKICILCVSTYIICMSLTYYCLQKFRIISSSVAHQRKTQ
ncbi:vitamin K epoxide reductase complex subunit 1-like protein 1 [Odontomachus brunneus]|uniref:vitamin K epoxide reductase complex subunit 1-like protein 1 n=1 Tax=Odontomachus brunneus TaxID=486640 RepID=UPI0013F1F67A|nr:vitamin K epoxide reductase complex subunit 1-like protein 1 [Odontomachus brunneus]